MHTLGKDNQCFTVAILLVTLLGPLGTGLAGVHMGMSGASDVGDAEVSHHRAMGHPAGTHEGLLETEQAAADHAAADEPMHHGDCAEPGSDSAHRCAGLWSTACCDYFSPETKIEIQPSLDSIWSAFGSLAATPAVESSDLDPKLGPLILPLTGEDRAGPSSLVILHSTLLL